MQVHPMRSLQPAPAPQYYYSPACHHHMADVLAHHSHVLCPVTWEPLIRSLLRVRAVLNASISHQFLTAFFSCKFAFSPAPFRPSATTAFTQDLVEGKSNGVKEMDSSHSCRGSSLMHSWVPLPSCVAAACTFHSLKCPLVTIIMYWWLLLLMYNILDRWWLM